MLGNCNVGLAELEIGISKFFRGLCSGRLQGSLCGVRRSRGSLCGIILVLSQKMIVLFHTTVPFPQNIKPLIKP